ncbi:MAG: zinc-dependent alcohol dehydrogenase family protein [Ignavibacteria bacterium]|jgi:2-desacetyl-2-hydroxyethyl bacteriochlorophyllide A dehydrogenase
MIAAIFREPGKIFIEESPLRKLRSSEVLVSVNYCGVCGTDKHIYEGNGTSKIPVILGHEFSGVVFDKAEDVPSNIQIGDPVTIDPNIHCGYCKYCREGKINFCENHRAIGVTEDGGFAEYVVVPAAQVYTLPKDFDLSLAAFAEPLSCCLRGIEHAKIKHGDSVVIIGGGSIGLLMVQLANMSGAADVVLIEPLENKQELGLELGADISLSPDEKDIQKIISEYTNGGADVVIECAGKKETVELSVGLVAKGGKVIIFGLSPKGEKLNIDLQYLFRNEISIYNSYLNPFTFASAVELLVSKRIKVEKLITEQIVLENINKIFNSNGNSQNIKCQVITKKKEELC